MVKKLKVALVGSGLIAVHRHLPAFAKLQKYTKVEAICDLDRERAQAIAHQFGIDQVYQDFNLLLENEKPDIIDICTPPHTHAQLAIAALKNGANVLIEKPMALNVEECDKIIEAMQLAKKSVGVAHSDLFYPAFIQAHRLVKQKTIGEFRGMRIFLSTPTDYMTSRLNHWAHRLPGGVIGESGPHAVYLTLAFINPICEVKVYGKKILQEYRHSAYEDYRIDLIGNNAVSSITLIYTTDQWAAEVDIFGSNGTIKIDLESQSLRRYRRPFLTPYTVGKSVCSEISQTVKSVSASAVKMLLRKYHRPHDLLIREFLETLQKGDPAPVSSDQGREAVRVMNLIDKELQS